MANNLPALPSVSRVRPLFTCSCGCGGTTQRAFVPGHDARLKGIIIRIVRGVMTFDDVKTWANEIGRGEQTVAAVKKAMANAALMKRWNITIEAPKADKTA